MKLRHLSVAVLAGAIGIGALSARTWTSADGTKTFEGEFKSWDEKAQTVTVLMRGGRTVTFEVAKLSEADQQFLKEAEPAAGGAVDEAAVADFSESKLGKALRKMEILEGKSFKKHEFAKPPEFFILYYSASW